MFNILFVCMGNICRSPSAEGFFTQALGNSSFSERISIDSAGTHAYHVGQAPDPRAVEAALDFGVDISGLRARKVNTTDFGHYHLMLAMDHSNLAILQREQPAASTTRLEMMMNYHPHGQPVDVPDPYYGGKDGFIYMCELLNSATAGLLNTIGEQLGQ